MDVAAVSWSNGRGGDRLIHVFVVGTNHKITEYVWDGGAWKKGSLGDVVTWDVAGIAATGYTSSKTGLFPGASKDYINVYIKGTDNKLTEWYRDDDGRWQIGEFSVDTDCKTMSVASYVKGASALSLRVYVINSNRQLVERCWDGDGWYTGELSLGGVDEVAATAWTTSRDQMQPGPEETHIRVYTKGSDNRVVERYWSDGDWEDGAYTPG